MQTSYPLQFGSLRPGARVDMRPVDIITAVADVAMRFGQFASFASMGTGPANVMKAKTPAASGDITGQGALLGVVASSQSYESQRDGASPNVPAKFAFNIIHRGPVVVYSEQAVDPTQPVFVRFTDNGALLAGNVRVDGDSGKAVQYPNAKFLGTTTGAGPVAIELNPTK